MTLISRLTGLAALASGFAWPAAHPTAVHILDHRHAELAAADPRGIRNSLDGWARDCHIVETGVTFKLECGPDPQPAEPQGDVEILPATLALMLDLDETLYLAGCPVLDAERLRRMERETKKPEQARAANPDLEDDLRDCADMEAGRTFSVEVEGDQMRAVIRGRQLRLKVFQVQPKERTTSTPYDAPPTRGSLGHAGPATTATADLNPVEEPNWAPPSEPQSQARPRNAEPSLRDPGVARTSLPSGRLRVQCKDAKTEIWIDEAFLGTAPLDLPLPAGRHTVVAKRTGQERKTEVSLEAGASLTIDACRPR